MDNPTTLDLKNIITVLEQKDKIENNPFANLPSDVIEEVLDVIETNEDGITSP
jgi:hypothetical protein